MNTEDQVILWEAPKIVPPEFRLYYDDNGKVVCYTCEKLDGKFIVIDAVTYASARPDVKVIDGKISTASSNAVVYKLMPSLDEDSTSCSLHDISIVVDKSFTGPVTKWKLKIYEL